MGKQPYKKRARARQARVPKAPYGLAKNTEIKSVEYLTTQQVGNAPGGNQIANSNDSTYAGAGGSIVNGATIIEKIQVGAGPNQRIGRQVKIKDVYMRYRISTNSGTSYQSALGTAGVNLIAPAQVRFLVLWDASPNGVDKVQKFSEIFGANMMANLKQEYINRYAILYDQIHTFAGHTAIVGAGAAYANPTISFAEGDKFVYKKLRVNRVATYSASNGELTDLQTGNLIFHAITDSPQPNATTSNFVWYMSARVTYSDS